MSDLIDRAQFERLSAIIEDSFGIADENGKVLFSVPDNLWPEGRIEGTLPKNREEHFFCQAGFCFYSCDLDGRLFYLFKREDTDHTCSLRVLRLIACLLEEHRLSKNNPAAFFRTLLTEGAEAVSPTELKQYENEKISGYTVIAVKASGPEDSGDEDLILQLLQNMFPEEQGYFTVPIDGGRFAIVCPVSGESDMADIRSMAELICDTLTSEIMVTSCVSLGSVCDKPEGMQAAYKNALEAAEIGTTFEMDQRCYVYGDLGIYRLIYQLDTKTCLQFLKETLGSDFFRDRSGPELLTTLRVFLDNNMNISEASRALYIHRNTLLYRMEKFNKLTGLDASRFDGAVKIRMACLVIKFLEKKAPEDLLGYIALYRKK